MQVETKKWWICGRKSVAIGVARLRSAAQSAALGSIVLVLGIIPTAAALYGFLRIPELILVTGGVLASLHLTAQHAWTRRYGHYRRAAYTVALLSFAIGSLLLTAGRSQAGYANVVWREDVAILSIVGPIRKEMAGQLIRALSGWDGPVRICADTPGGDVVSSLMLAGYIRSFGAGSSIVARQCDSACGVLWSAAGQRAVVMRPGSTDRTGVGLHRVSGELLLLVPVMQGAYNSTLRDNGADEATVQKLMRHDAMWELLPQELIQSGMPGEVIAISEYQRLCR